MVSFVIGRIIEGKVAVRYIYILTFTYNQIVKTFDDVLYFKNCYNDSFKNGMRQSV